MTHVNIHDPPCYLVEDNVDDNLVRPPTMNSWHLAPADPRWRRGIIARRRAKNGVDFFERHAFLDLFGIVRIDAPRRPGSGRNEPDCANSPEEAGDYCHGNAHGSYLRLNERQRLLRRRDRLPHVFLRVYRHQERGLELAARQIDAALQHRPEKAAELGGVAFLGAIVIDDRLGIEE